MGISPPHVSDIERTALWHTQLDTIRAYVSALGEDFSTSPTRTITAAMRVVDEGLKAALDLD